MKASDYIINFIEQKGIDHIFGYIGGAITHLVDSIDKNKFVKFIQVYHEQTAAFAAEGYSRNSGKTGVAMATSGPGATNLITGIADAYFDSIPVVFITGQVNTYEYKYNKPVRQQGFQETDIVSIVKTITKYATIIDDPKMIRSEVEKAFYIASEGRPGPVLIDIPMNIQRAEIDSKKLKRFIPSPKKTAVKSMPKSFFANATTLLKQSKRPMILAGGGVIRGKAENSLLKFAQKNNIPVVVSLMGKGAFPENNNLFVGMIGSYGNRCANIALSNADLLFALGTRLDTRQVGTFSDSFLREGKIIHVEIDKNEIKNNRINRHLKIRIDSKIFLDEFNKIKYKKRLQVKWLKYIKKIKTEYSQEKEIEKNCANKFPYEIMNLLNKYSKNNQIYCVDIGQNQMFAAQTLQIKNSQNFFTSGGMAPMGYSVPVAIGISFSDTERKNITAITGDGGLHISLQALMLISQYKLPIKIIVLNNYILGMITQFQNLYFNKRMVGTTKESGYLVPNFKSIAAAYNIDYYRLDKRNLNIFDKIFKKSEPCLIELAIEDKTVVYPKLEVNTPIEDMSPKLDRKELKDAMIIKIIDGKKIK